jgi:hypothetical protein
MKFLKVLLGIVVVLAIAVGVTSFVVPTETTVEHSIVINVPKERAYEYLRVMKNQEQWGPWYKADPNMRIVTQGADGEIGHVVAWEGNSEVGIGEQEIKSLKQDERIDSELRFKKPMEGIAQTWFTTEETGANQTKVTWGMHSVSKRPFNALCFLVNAATGMMDKMFTQGLNDLKTVLESAPAAESAPTTEVVPEATPEVAPEAAQ